MPIHPIHGFRAFFGIQKRKPSDHLDLSSLQIRVPKWIRFRTVVTPALIGFSIVAVANLLEGLHPGQPLPRDATILNVLGNEAYWMQKAVEVGSAFMIAAIVAYFIDRSARAEQTRLFDEALRVIGNDVVQGVYGIRHNKEYVKAVVVSSLSIMHVRRNYEVFCQISDFSPEECASLGVAHNTLVKIKADVKYISENIGNRKETFLGKYFIPKIANGIGDLTQLEFLRVGDKEYSTRKDIESIELKMGHDDYSHTDLGYIFPIKVKPGGFTEVHLKAVFAKERSDNEIYTFLLPTIGAKIRFHFEMPSLTIGVKPRCASDSNTEETLKGREIIWSTTGPLLPNNAVTVWWREAVPDKPAPSADNHPITGQPPE